MEGWRDQSKWLLRLEDFKGHSVGDSFESMLTALGRVARSKHQRELSSRGRESGELLATTSTSAPRKGEIMERHGGSNRSVLTEPVRVGGKRKAMEEALSWEEMRRRVRLRREVVEEDIGFATETGDKEWSLREEKSRDPKRKVGFNTKAGEGSSKESKGSRPAAALSRTPADMPQEFKDRINGMGGKEIKLVIEKELSRTDLDRHICRVSIPKNQVRDPSFLRDEENRVLEKQNAMDVSVIGPKYSRVLKFALLEMGSKNKAKPSLIYNFRSGWNNFASENKLKVGDKIQIWSFRVDSDHRCDELCFALDKLDNDIGKGGDVGRSDGTMAAQSEGCFRHDDPIFRCNILGT